MRWIRAIDKSRSAGSTRKGITAAWWGPVPCRLIFLNRRANQSAAECTNTRADRRAADMTGGRATDNCAGRRAYSRSLTDRGFTRA